MSKRPVFVQLQETLGRDDEGDITLHSLSKHLVEEMSAAEKRRDEVLEMMRIMQRHSEETSRLLETIEVSLGRHMAAASAGRPEAEPISTQDVTLISAEDFAAQPTMREMPTCESGTSYRLSITPDASGRISQQPHRQSARRRSSAVDVNKVMPSPSLDAALSFADNSPDQDTEAWLSELKQKKPEGQIQRGSPDLTLGVVLMHLLIVTNSLYIGIVLQYQATTVEEKASRQVFWWISSFFFVAFLVELAVRFIYDLREAQMRFTRAIEFFFLRAHSKHWNIFDTVMVVMSLVNLAAAAPASWVSSLRLLRLLRLLRILRAVRVMSAFREFGEQAATMIEGLGALFWTGVIMLFLVYMLSCVLVSAAQDECIGGNRDSEVCKYFGSVSVSMLSLVEASTGGLQWSVLYRALEDLGAVLPLFLMAFIVFWTLALTSTVVATFIDIHTRVQQQDVETNAATANREKRRRLELLFWLFHAMDETGEGALTREELSEAIQDPNKAHLLQGMGMENVSADLLFTLMDKDHHAWVNVDEFVYASHKLTGGVTALDLYQLHLQMLPALKGIAKIDAMVSYMAESQGVRFELMPTKKNAAKGKQRKTARQFRKTNDKRSIEKVEHRAMTLQELLNVQATVEGAFQEEPWMSQRTGQQLSPESVNLYDLNYHHICPVTVPSGVQVKLSFSDLLIELMEKSQQEGVKLEVVLKKPENVANIRAEGEVILSKPPSDEPLVVKVLKGSFENPDNELHIFINGHDVGQAVSVNIIGDNVSYKEAISCHATKPLWFCSHWWGEPVLDFVACCKEHTILRETDFQKSSYWVCAYANRQHELGLDMPDDPERSSFHKAMRESKGVVVILDQYTNVFRRIWCDFELFNAVKNEMSIDICTAASKSDKGKSDTVYLLSQEPLPGETLFYKTRREGRFPMKILVEGMHIDLAKGEASHPEDTHRIMRFMRKSTPKDIEADFIEYVNRSLRSFFALAAWPQAIGRSAVHDFGGLNLAEVCSKDTSRRTLFLSFSHMEDVDDGDLEDLARGMSPNLTAVELSFNSCGKITDKGVEALVRKIPGNVNHLRLDFASCKLTNKSLKELARHLPKRLSSFRLHLNGCDEIGIDGLHALSRAIPDQLKDFAATLKGTQFDGNITSVGKLKSYRRVWGG